MNLKNQKINLLKVSVVVLLAAFAVGSMPTETYATTTKKQKIVYPPLFGSKEKRSRNFKPFKKWTAAIERYSKEQANIQDGACKSKKFNKCHYDKWQKFLKSLEGKSKLAQITAVNKYMNKARYITDPNNWGKKDYWATPGQFMAKFGDCEDYAIAKYMSLKQLGFKASEMRVVAVKDLNLKVGHAILAVYHKGTAYILDNQIRKVAKADVIKHYVPVFSINQKYWWRHKKG